MPRLRWTLEEFERLAELGIFTEEDRIELIGGAGSDVAKGNRHELVRSAILNWLRRICQTNSIFTSSRVGVHRELL